MSTRQIVSHTLQSRVGRFLFLIGVSFFLLTICLQLLLPARLVAAHLPQTFPWGTATIGEEVYGLAGPTSVSCVNSHYQNARTTLDAQRANWESVATTALPGAIAIHSFIAGPAGSPVNGPLLLQQPDGFSITLTSVDMAANQGYHSGSTANGTPSFADVQINGGSSGCTMQDNAPKASSAVAGDYYLNQLNNLRGLNGIRLTFSTPVQAFGAFVGDLETSLRGTTAFLRLLDNNGALIADVPIPSSLGLSGGIAAENTQCDTSNVPGADVVAQGLAPGCGNGSTRWIGFVSNSPVAQAVVVVGDNDPLPGGLGLTEKLSLMGVTVVRTLPTAEVSLRKEAPAQVQVGEPFNYTLIISNSGDTLAGGIVLTDVAPAGISFVSVAGNGCTLVAGTVSCVQETLPAHTATTILIRAVAAVTATVTNLAQITALNDVDGSNNQASVSVTALAKSPINYCAPAVNNSGQSLVINEVLYNEVGADGDEWVELYVSNGLTGGALYFISDDETTGTGFNRTITVPVGGIPAGTYIVIHDDSGTDDLDLTDGVIQLWGAGNGGVSGTTMRNSGDNITLYAGNAALAANAIDYVRFFTSTNDTTNDAPPAGVPWSGFAPNTGDGQSIALIRNGVDGSNGGDWAASGANGTVGLSTPGANNNGLTACNVAIGKSGPTSIAVGQNFDYLLTLRNTTPVTLSNVVVTDVQPAGVAFQSVTGSGCNLEAGTISCVVGTMLPTSSQIITINATATNAQTVLNRASTSALSDTLSADNVATHTLSVQALGSIGDFIYLDPNQNGSQESGETTPINGVPVTLTLPNGTQRTTVSEDGLYHFDQLPAGVYTVTVGSAPGYVRTSNQSYVVTLGVGQQIVYADFGFYFAVAELTLNKTSVTTATVGESFPYTLQVTNLSNVTTALDVVITDTQPVGILFTSVDDARCGLFAGELTCNLGALAPLVSQSIVLHATAQNAGSSLNQAWVTGRNTNNTPASVTTTIQSQVSPLRLYKSILQPTNLQVWKGDPLLYAIRLENAGATTITTASLVDRYPSTQLQFNYASITPTLQASGLLTWMLSSQPALLAPGESLTITVAFTVTE